MVGILVDAVASAVVQAQHGGHAHSMGPYSLAAAVFPYVSLGFIYAKRAILRARYRREAEAHGLEWPPPSP